MNALPQNPTEIKKHINDLSMQMAKDYVDFQQLCTNHNTRLTETRAYAAHLLDTIGLQSKMLMAAQGIEHGINVEDSRALYETSATEVRALREQSPMLREGMLHAETVHTNDTVHPYVPSEKLQKLVADAVLMQNSLFVQAGHVYDDPAHHAAREAQVNKDGATLGCLLLEALHTSELERTQQALQDVRVIKEGILTEVVIAHNPNATSWKDKIQQPPSQPSPAL
jgi:hypothetical protein